MKYIIQKNYKLNSINNHINELNKQTKLNKLNKQTKLNKHNKQK